MATTSSPDQFLKKHDISHVVQSGINAAYVAGSHNPVAFLAKYFADKTAVDVIEDVSATEVLDGSGSCALSVTVRLANGVTTTAQSSHNNHTAPHPSAAREVVFVTDKQPAADAKELAKQRFGGNGLRGPVDFINTKLKPALVGQSLAQQDVVDHIITVTDGSANYSVIGAQCAATVSTALAQAAALSLHRPAFLSLAAQYYAFTGVPRALAIPTPVVTLFSTEPKWLGKVRVLEVCLIPKISSAVASGAEGGANGDNGGTSGKATPASNVVDDSTTTTTIGKESQTPSPSAADVGVAKALCDCMRVIEEAQIKLAEDGHPVAVAPDGALKYNVAENLQALVDYTEEIIKDAGFTPGQDFGIGLIVDASYCYKAEPGKYGLIDGTDFTGPQLAEFLANLKRDRPNVIYIEDPLLEKDQSEMKRLLYRVGATTAVAGNNYHAGNPQVVKASAEGKAMNTAVLKLNDCGTVTDAVALGQTFQLGYPGAGIAVAGDARLGAGSFLADFATGVGAKFIRAGGLLRPDHAAAYNRLVEIETELRERSLLADSQMVTGGSPLVVDYAHLELPPAPTEPVQEVNVKDAKKKK